MVKENGEDPKPLGPPVSVDPDAPKEIDELFKEEGKCELCKKPKEELDIPTKWYPDDNDDPGTSNGPETPPGWKKWPKFILKQVKKDEVKKGKYFTIVLKTRKDDPKEKKKLALQCLGEEVAQVHPEAGKEGRGEE